jgi:hypothetical protein
MASNEGGNGIGVHSSCAFGTRYNCHERNYRHKYNGRTAKITDKTGDITVAKLRIIKARI